MEELLHCIPWASQFTGSQDLVENICEGLCFCAASIATPVNLPFMLCPSQRLRTAEARLCLICKQAYQRTVESANLQEKVFALIRLKVQLLMTKSIIPLIPAHLWL